MEPHTKKPRADFRIDFDGKEWKTPFPGSRYKAYRSGDRLVRIAEFTPEFTEADWCEKGHIGYVIEGSMQIDCHGRIEILEGRRRNIHSARRRNWTQGARTDAGGAPLTH